MHVKQRAISHRFYYNIITIFFTELAMKIFYKVSMKLYLEYVGKFTIALLLKRNRSIFVLILFWGYGWHTMFP